MPELKWEPSKIFKNFNINVKEIKCPNEKDLLRLRAEWRPIALMFLRIFFKFVCFLGVGINM